ncbi:MAG: endonuclease/exonuclease/phosphatase family protein [Acidobacteriota bacterium]
MVRVLVFLTIFPALVADPWAAELEQSPLFAYEELVQLYELAVPAEALQEKQRRLLTTPFVSNQASDRGAMPFRPAVPGFGAGIRVALWNIERGLKFDFVKAAFSNDTELVIRPEASENAALEDQLSRIKHQMLLLQEADVIVLNEVDWGMKRTGYRNVAKELAAALNMNYAFGVQFVEVDPLSLGIERFEEMDPETQARLIEYTRVDRQRYKGLHGTAILSRYRLNNVRLIPFDHQSHDWYEDEKKGMPRLESGKRTLAEMVFLQKMHRQVRRGGRMMLMAEIADPDIPTGKAVVIATHLENHAQPAGRLRQLKELLARIQDVAHPVIIAGDMNTTARDGTPISVRGEIARRLGSESFWLTQAFKLATGFGMLLDLVIGGFNFSRTHADPTVINVPIFAHNPERTFFKTLEDFRFSDGGAFDFRGEPKCAGQGRSGTLANSNERGSKGFVTTYEVARTIGPSGKFKLDWIFVKPPSLRDPRDKGQSCRFAPHFPRTLTNLNGSITDRISDHSPIIVELPFGRPISSPELP